MQPPPFQHVAWLPLRIPIPLVRGCRLNCLPHSNWQNQGYLLARLKRHLVSRLLYVGPEQSRSFNFCLDLEGHYVAQPKEGSFLPLPLAGCHSDGLWQQLTYLL